MANYEITDNYVNVEPNGVLWSLEGSQISSFVFNLLNDAGIEGVLRPQIAIEHEGSNVQGVTCVAFFRPNSPDVTGISLNNTNNFLVREIVGPGIGKPSERLQKVLKPLVRADQDGSGTNLRLIKHKGKSYLVVALDIFRVLSAMLKAPRRKYEIVILSSYNVPNSRDCVLQVVKKLQPPESIGNDENTALRNIAMEIARGRRD